MAAEAPRAWQRMLSGRRLDLLDPSPLDIEIEDIAHGLARVARWNGQTVGQHIFSVAQHSLLIEAFSGELQPELPAASRLTVLLHDAAEYVLGDVFSPFKAVIGDGYTAVEARLSSAIYLRLGLPAEPSASLKRIMKRSDRLAAFDEATRLAGFAQEEALRFFGQPDVNLAALEEHLTPWPIHSAEIVRLLAIRHGLPFEVARDRDQASGAPEGGTEERLLLHCLCTSIEGPRRLLGLVLPLIGDKTPPHRHELAPAIPLDHSADGIGRADVVARL